MAKITKEDVGKTTQKVTGEVKGFFNDFKKFITKGNIIDLAVAVIIGGAFGKIVSSLVDNIFMPLIGLVLNKNLAELVWVVKPATQVGGTTVPATVLNYGMFLQNILDFLIIALCIFTALRVMVAIQKNYSNIEKRINNAMKDLRTKYKRELKKQKKTPEEIEAALAEYDANEKAKLEAATVAVVSSAPAPKTEELLADIKDLLVQQTQFLKDQSENKK